MSEPDKYDKETAELLPCIFTEVKCCSPRLGLPLLISGWCSVCRNRPHVAAALRKQGAEIEQLRDINLTYYQDRIGAVWYWQGDSYDYPESLACPVIMQPEKLRALLAEIERLKAELALPEQDRGRTHYEGCWRDRGHHGCANAEIERLKAERLLLAKYANDEVLYNSFDVEAARELRDKILAEAR